MAGAPPEHVELLTQYGERIGVAFQLADDLVDPAELADAVNRVSRQ